MRIVDGKRRYFRRVAAKLTAAVANPRGAKGSTEPVTLVLPETERIDALEFFKDTESIFKSLQFWKLAEDLAPSSGPAPCWKFSMLARPDAVADSLSAAFKSLAAEAV